MNLFRTPFFLPKFYPSLLWRVPTQKKELYLTFDDGPVNGPTEFVLEELKRFNAKATFFCIGDNVRKHPDVFEKIIAGGHTVGNHTFNHLKGWSTPIEEYIANIKKCDDLINLSLVGNRQGAVDSQLSNSQQLTANSQLFFRPPYGRITLKQIKALKDQYKIVMWDVLTHDYSKSISRQNCLNGSIHATRPGSIIVFHDSLKAERNLTHVLPKFLAHFTEQGYEFKSLANA